jgi:hypothetical protein
MKTNISCWITFSENCTVYEIMLKHIVETEEPQMTSQHGAYALSVGLARLHALMRMHTLTCPRTHMHALKHAPTHRPISNIRIAFPRQQ